MTLQTYSILFICIDAHMSMKKSFIDDYVKTQKVIKVMQYQLLLTLLIKIQVVSGFLNNVQ